VLSEGEEKQKGSQDPFVGVLVELGASLAETLAGSPLRKQKVRTETSCLLCRTSLSSVHVQVADRSESGLFLLDWQVWHLCLRLGQGLGGQELKKSVARVGWWGDWLFLDGSNRFLFQRAKQLPGVAKHQGKRGNTTRNTSWMSLSRLSSL
jgi:hypothetical protein